MGAGRLPFVGIALVCAVLGVYLAVSSRNEVRLGQARADVAAGRDAQALAELEGLGGESARRAASLRGTVYLRRGRLARARVEFEAATRRDPNNWVLQRDYAIVLLRGGERQEARERMQRARALNPRMPLPRGFVASR